MGVSKWIYWSYNPRIYQPFTNVLGPPQCRGQTLENLLWNLGALVLWNGLLVFLYALKIATLKRLESTVTHIKNQTCIKFFGEVKDALKVFCRLKCLCFFNICLKRSYLSCWKDVENTPPRSDPISIGEPSPQIVECRVWIMSFGGILYFWDI